MMKLIGPLTTILVAIGFFLSTGSVQAQGDLPLDRLNLTEAQKAQVKQLKDKFKQETESIQAEIKKLLDQENAAKKTTPANEAVLKAIMQQRAGKEIELSLALNRLKHDLEGVLTPGQREALKKLKDAR